MSRYVFIKPSASENEIKTYAESRIATLGQSIQFSVTITPGVSATLSGSIRYTFLSLIAPSVEISKTANIPLGELN